MTLSRGGIASILFMLFIAFVFTDLKRKKTIYKFGATILIIVVIVSLLKLNKDDFEFDSNIFKSDYITSFFDNSSDTDGSVNHRINEMILAKEYATKYFPFGGGANRKELQEKIPVIESLYGYHLIKWGVLGLLMHLLGIIYILYICYKTYHSDTFKNNKEIQALLYAFFLTVLSVPLIYGFSSAISDRFKCLPFHYIICGYIFILYRQTKSHNVAVNGK